MMPLSCFYKKKYANLGDRGAYFDCIVLEEFESIGDVTVVTSERK